MMPSPGHHALAIVLLPATVAVVIPAWIARRVGTEIGLPASSMEWAISVVGMAVLLVGSALFMACLDLPIDLYAGVGAEGAGAAVFTRLSLQP